MSRTASWGSPQSPDRLRSLVALLVTVAVLVVLTSFGFLLRADLAKPSTESCLSVIIGAPLLILARFGLRQRRRRRTRELRDARRGGISIGLTRPRWETAAQRSPMPMPRSKPAPGHDVLTLEV